MSKLTDNNAEKILANSRASLGIEGLKPSEEETDIIRRYLKGELIEEEVINIISEYSGMKGHVDYPVEECNIKLLGYESEVEYK